METGRSQLPTTDPLLLERPLRHSRCSPGISFCAGGTEALLGSTLVKVAGPHSLPPFATRSAAGGAPSSFLWDCSAGASDLPCRASQNLPSPGSPATAASSRPATHAQIDRGMTNAIGLEEPHLKRDRRIQGGRVRYKGPDRPRPQALRGRRNHLYENQIQRTSDVYSRFAPTVCKHLDSGTGFPEAARIVPHGTSKRGRSEGTSTAAK